MLMKTIIRITITQFTQEKQWGLFQYKVITSLAVTEQTTVKWPIVQILHKK